jgi:hypothetical protein
MCFPGLFADLIFYTTKPLHFLDPWMFLPFGAAFAISAATIPFSAALVRRSVPRASYRIFLLVYATTWVGVAALASLGVSLFTAAIHNATLSIPVWLVPIGFVFIPAAAGTTILLAGFRKATHTDEHL